MHPVQLHDTTPGAGPVQNAHQVVAFGEAALHVETLQMLLTE
jgi:hypothetical protein